MKESLIVIIDDDIDDLQIYKDVLSELVNPARLYLFDSAQDALNFLKQSESDCFFILCDINMPQMNGFEFREAMIQDEVLTAKGIPFLFLSTSKSSRHVNKAFDRSVQGYFEKPGTWDGIKSMFQTIIHYWTNSKNPGKQVFVFSRQ